MEGVATQTDNADEYSVEVARRRAALAQQYDALPHAPSPAFWSAIADPTLPLEVLVRVVRAMVRAGNEQGWRQLLECIFTRIQVLNERWAQHILQTHALPLDERQAMVNDICADLHERLLRALLDPERRFWEENFLHCLYFERKHVYHAFMRREGRWHEHHVHTRGMRVPRSILSSLNQLQQHLDGHTSHFDIEDQQAQATFLAVERIDILQMVLALPEQLKATVLLIFWEGRTEKESAQILGISDRAIRYRLQRALTLLRAQLAKESECSSYD